MNAHVRKDYGESLWTGRGGLLVHISAKYQRCIGPAKPE